MSWGGFHKALGEEDQLLGYKAGRYVHAPQFEYIRKVTKHQRTIVGCLQPELGLKITTLSQAVQEALGHTLRRR